MELARIMVIALLGPAIGACTSGAGEGRTRQAGPPAATAEGQADDIAALPAGAALQGQVEAGPTLAEAAARALLAERFRAAGLRVRNDVHIEGEGFELTADGYDPERRVGFEYIATEEVGTDLLEAERAALRDDTALRLLVVGASDERTLRRAADEFLVGVGLGGARKAGEVNAEDTGQ